MRLGIGEHILAYDAALRLDLDIVERKRIEHLGDWQATGHNHRIITTIQVGARPAITIGIGQVLHNAAGIKGNDDLGVPVRASAAGIAVVTGGVVVFNCRGRGITH